MFAIQSRALFLQPLASEVFKRETVNMAETSLPLEWNFANWEALEADIRNSAAHFGVEVPELVFEQLKQYYNTHFPVRASRMGVFMRF